MSRFGLFVTLITLSASPVGATTPNPKDLVIPTSELAKARNLVEKLGSEAFDDREVAQDTLAKMGRLALPALVDGFKKHASPEVRFRCHALLPRATAEDFQARLDTFLADTDGKFDHDLNGWNEFRKMVGNTSESRAVFVELLAAPVNRTLVMGASLPGVELSVLVATRKLELYTERFPRNGNTSVKQPSVADLIALMFTESLFDAKATRGVLPNYNLFFNSPNFVTSVTDPGPKGQVYKSIVAHWIETRDDPYSMYQAITLGTTLGLKKEATGTASKLLQMKGGIATYRAQAAMTIARLEAKDQLPALEATLTDESSIRVARQPVGGGVAAREIVEIQLRDISLAAALLLTDQDPKEYGFSSRPGSPAIQYNYSQWILAADKREAALAKWKAWREKHPNIENDKPKK